MNWIFEAAPTSGAEGRDNGKSGKESVGDELKP
jgi:hypothetical protein